MDVQRPETSIEHGRKHFLMNNFEVTEPILNSPFEEPKEHWWILEGEAPERRPGAGLRTIFTATRGRQRENRPAPT